jgi:hypothetical protein
MQPEQELALEVTRRLAYNAPRDQLAEMLKQLMHDNMILREALMEILGEDPSQVRHQ